MAELKNELLLLIILIPIAIITAIPATNIIENTFAQIPRDTDQDGIPDNIDQCPRQPETFNGFQDNDGCPDTVQRDFDNDGIADTNDKCPKEPENYNQFEDGDGCPDDPKGPSKVQIFAKKKNNVILLSWENPLDIVDNIKYNYKIIRSTNLQTPDTIFNSQRNIDEKVINKAGNEKLFFLDEKITAGNNYTYQVITENPNNLNTIISEKSDTILIPDTKIQLSIITSKAYLIQGRELTPIPQIETLLFNPVHAEIFIDSTFTTPLNPQDKSYRLALEPMQNPNNGKNCNQYLDFEYSRNIAKGQDFIVTASIFEKQIVTDDIEINGTETKIQSEIEILRHQKTFDKFTDSDNVKQKWLVIEPEFQTIFNFTNLEIQFDISAETATAGDYRSLNFWDIFFIVPIGGNC